MKLISTSIFFILIVFSSCTPDIDYNPDLKTPNPLESITVPDEFDWSSITSFSLTVKANDEYNGQYYYTIEVYDDNPISNPESQLLCKGYAKENIDFPVGLTVNNNIDFIYIKQIDPQERERIRKIEITPETYCDFSSLEEANINAPANRVRTRAVIEIPSYSTEDETFVNATELTRNTQFQNNTNYKITGTFNDKTKYSGQANVKLFVAGTWNLSENIKDEIQIIVLEGGTIITDELKSTGTADITIMPGGKIEVKKNMTLGTTNSFYNLGELIVKGEINAQNGAGSIFYVGSDAIIESNVLTIANKDTYIENHGTITVNTLTGGGGAIIYNSCSINVNNELNMQGIANVTMDRGILRAPRILLHDTYILMRNGSMIKCEELHDQNKSTIYGESGGKRSLIKSEKVTVPGNISNTLTLSGNLLLEYKQLINQLNIINGAEIALYDISDLVITACTGEGNKGNPGKTPKVLEFPIIVPVNNTYTFIFEDQWPIYSDYDMNDVVFKVDNIKTALNNQNKAERFSFDVTLQAAGASKRIAAALMLDKIPSSNIKTLTYNNGNNPRNFNTNVVGVEEGQTNAVIPLSDNVHASLGAPHAWFINTYRDNADNTDILPVISICVEFHNPVYAIDLNINYLNFFIITDILTLPVYANPRKEIHIIGYAPTDMVDVDIFGNHNDASSISDGRYYVSKDNLAWGIIIPDEFNWAQELVDIQFAYSEFTDWVTSGGERNKSWWENPDRNNVFYE